MQESKLNVQYPNCIDVYPSDPIKKLVNKGLGELAYLFQPADTTVQTNHWHKDHNNREMSSIREVVKAVFWIAASIAVPLIIGL